MVDKYRGALPKGSIWFHFERSELISFLKANPEMLPKDAKIDFNTLDDGDLHAIDVLAMEKAIAKAGLAIVTLFD